MKEIEILLALADEDAHGLMVIHSALEEKGYRVTTETREESTTERIPINDFDLVVTDLLPVLERAKELNPGIMAILVLATSSKSISTVHAIRSSADDYLFRPFGLAEMEMRVSRCIEKLEAQKTNPQPESCDLGLNEKMLNVVKALSHDVRGSLLSISATLKLLIQGSLWEDGRSGRAQDKRSLLKNLRADRNHGRVSKQERLGRQRCEPRSRSFGFDERPFDSGPEGTLLGAQGTPPHD